MSGISIVIISSGLIGRTLARDEALATLPYACMVVGIACGTFPAAFLMRRFGRRAAFMAASLIGVVSSGVCVTAIASSEFLGFCVGLYLLGFSSAFVSFYRFAAADMETDDRKSGAVSLVVLGTLPAAFIAPRIVGWSADVYPASPYLAAYGMIAGMGLLSATLISRLHPLGRPHAFARRSASVKRIFLNPVFLAATACCTIAYACMNLLMVSSPLAMVAQQHTVHTASQVIQWHLVAMYLPSVFSGLLVRRFGMYRIIVVGLLAVAAAAGYALSGTSVLHFMLALILVGGGWNLVYVGGSTLLTRLQGPDDQARAQALSNFVVFAGMTGSSLLAGTILHHLGWAGIGAASLLLTVVCVPFLWPARLNETRASR